MIQKHTEKIKIRELLVRPTYNKNAMATFNVPRYVQVYMPTSYTWKNEYKCFIFQDRA